MLHVIATSPGALSALDTETQDAIFEVDDIAYDAAGGVLTVPLRRWSYEEARLIGEDPPTEGWRKHLAGPRSKRWEAPWYRWLLRIVNVDSYTVSDTTQAGGSSIEHVSYDAARAAVIVQGSIPVTIEALVQRRSRRVGADRPSPRLRPLRDHRSLVRLHRRDLPRGGDGRPGRHVAAAPLSRCPA